MRLLKRLIARALLALLLLVLLYQLWIFLHICWWNSHNPSSTAFMREQLAVLQEKNPEAELQYRWRDYRRISTHLKRAVIASEDAKFVQHDGFDWDGIQNALEKTWRRGEWWPAAPPSANSSPRTCFFPPGARRGAKCRKS